MSSGKVIFGLYGAGGFAREVMPLVAEWASNSAPTDRAYAPEVYFVEPVPHFGKLHGLPVISEEAFFRIDCAERFFNVAIGDSKVRERIAAGCVALGAKPMTLRSSHAIVYASNQIGEGAILCANTMVTADARIGKFFHANIYSYVAHDCEIGDFVTFAPNVHCNGNVRVERHAYVGTGAIIKQGTSKKPLVIGEGAVVGMGAVVTKDVAAFTTVVGNPARPLVKA
jgi:sugar O-acyltransferase (sialic acid O-acetyltransferase NeuD family)